MQGDPWVILTSTICRVSVIKQITFLSEMQQIDSVTRGNIFIEGKLQEKS